MARLRMNVILAALLLGPAGAFADPPPEEVPAPRPVAEVVPLPPPPLFVPRPPRPILPLSRPVPPELLLPPPPLLPPVPPEFGRRSVWGFYGVTRQGQFRPLVVETPYGAYYRYDGSPFPWVGVRREAYMPRVVD